MNQDFMQDIDDEQLELAVGGHHHPHHCNHHATHPAHYSGDGTTIIYIVNNNYTINNTSIILNSPGAQIINLTSVN